MSDKRPKPVPESQHTIDVPKGVPTKHTPYRVVQYWKKAAHSMHKNMSRGAEYISSLISWPHGDSWRRGDGKKHR